MLKWLTWLTNWILIYTNQENKTKAEIGFIFKINPIQNLAMMSQRDLEWAQETMRTFLSINNYTFSIVKKKVDVTDYDYLPNYEAIVSRKNLKSWNILHKEMLHGTAKMIQEYTKWTTKHEYFLKINTFIEDTSSDKEIIRKHKELENILKQFPEQYRIEKMLSSKEVIIYLMKEVRFAKSEINTLINTDLGKLWYYKDILKVE